MTFSEIGLIVIGIILAALAIYDIRQMRRRHCASGRCGRARSDGWPVGN